MLISDTNTIRRKMNEYGRRRLPFLFVINFEMTEGYFVENPLEQRSLLFQINGIGNKTAEKPRCACGQLKAQPISRQEYKSKFDIVYDGLACGNSFLANLTVKTPVQTSLSLEDIFQYTHAKYQLFIPGKFVCYSPECFVRIAGGVISTYPMKGTIDASMPGAEQALLSDCKEKAEHYTIVDLLRNDLSINAEDVCVKRFRYIDRIKTSGKEILQASSEITGRLPAGSRRRMGDIIFQMLPAGSISGAPKPSTLDIISRAEKEPRGYYTGIFGYFDGSVLDSGVIIRYVEEAGGQKFFRSGGGITAASSWEREYSEVLDKIYLPLP